VPELSVFSGSTSPSQGSTCDGPSDRCTRRQAASSSHVRQNRTCVAQSPFSLSLSHKDPPSSTEAGIAVQLPFRDCFKTPLEASPVTRNRPRRLLSAPCRREMPRLDHMPCIRGLDGRPHRCIAADAIRATVAGAEDSAGNVVPVSSSSSSIVRTSVWCGRDIYVALCPRGIIVTTVLWWRIISFIPF
jgi:hypothetical protein